LKNATQKFTDEFTASQTELNTKDIIYCRIVLTHVHEVFGAKGYKDRI